MTLQAAGARRVADSEPGRALAALGRIESTARAALDDIREVIGVLRAGDELALGPPRTFRRGCRRRGSGPRRGTPAASRCPRTSRRRHADVAARGWRCSSRSASRSSRRPSSRGRWCRTSLGVPRSPPRCAPAPRAPLARRSPRSPRRACRRCCSRRSRCSSRRSCCCWCRAYTVAALAAAAGGARRAGDLRRRDVRASAAAGPARDRTAGLRRRSCRARPRTARAPSCTRSRSSWSGRATLTPPARAARSACASRASCTTRSPTA